MTITEVLDALAVWASDNKVDSWISARDMTVLRASMSIREGLCDHWITDPNEYQVRIDVATALEKAAQSLGYHGMRDAAGDGGLIAVQRVIQKAREESEL